jgi:hypothetical protein
MRVNIGDVQLKFLVNGTIKSFLIIFVRIKGYDVYIMLLICIFMKNVDNINVYLSIYN